MNVYRNTETLDSVPRRKRAERRALGKKHRNKADDPTRTEGNTEATFLSRLSLKRLGTGQLKVSESLPKTASLVHLDAFASKGS